MPTLLLDSMSLLFRAHYALPPMNTSSGEPTAAMYGLSSLVLKLLREHPGSAIAFALDAPGGSFRREMYDAYKAGRPATPDALSSQFARLRELIAALGAPAFIAPGFEADDVLATLAAHEEGSARVVTGDRDLFQVIAPQVDVLFVGRRGAKPVVYDEAKVLERFGVPPVELPAYVALVGDPSDNIEGLAGVGPRTATAWVREHGSVEAIVAAVDALKPARLRDAVREAAVRLQTNERLVQLRRDVPLDDSLRPTALGDEAIGRTVALFEALEFKSLIPRLEKLRG